MDEKILFQEFFEPFMGVPNLPLNGRSLQLARTVYILATREINKSLKKSKPSPKAELLPENLKDVLDLSDKCDGLKANLRNVVDLFEVVEESRTEFVNHFDDFKSLRLKLIDEFQDITSTLDYAVYRWNLGRIVRRTLMMAGGIAVLGPVLFSPLTPLAMMPLAAGGISGAAAIYAWRALARHGIIKDQMLLNAQANRMKDLQNVKRLKCWFDSSEELVKTLTELLGGHTLDVMIRDWRHFLHQVKNIQINDIWVAPLLKQWVKDVCACWILQPKYGPDITPVILTFAFVVLFLQEKNVVLLECISRTRRVVPQWSLVGKPCDVKDSVANPKCSHEWEGRRMSEKGGRKVCEDLQLETSDLVGLARSLKEEAGFLQSICCVLKMSLEEELACLSAFSMQNEERFPSSMYEAGEQEKRSAIIIFNIPCSAKEDDVIPLIEALLPPAAKGTVKFLKTMGGLVGDNWVLEINKNHLPMLLKRKITVSEQTCPIDIYFGIFRCGKCQRFGHNVRNCEHEVACGECSENHSVKNCEVKKEKCINCVRFNERNSTDFNVNHPVDGRKCQTYHNLKEHLRNGKSLKAWIKMAG